MGSGRLHGWGAAADDGTYESLARAYRLIDDGDTEDRASLVIRPYLYQFPRPPIVIVNRTYSLARAVGENAVYYLSEDRIMPLSDKTI
jgi:hypothetical protein